MPLLSFALEPLSAIIPAVRAALEEGEEVTLEVPDPDAGLGLYAGELYAGAAGPAGRHRPWSAWADLADALGAHLLTPQPSGPGRARFGLRRYAAAPAPDAGGYGVGGDWARVDKLEDPVLLLTLVEALRRIDPPVGARVLALGVNSGRELDALALAFPGRPSPDRHLLDRHFPDRHFPDRRFEVVGVDTDASALAAARGRYPAATFLELDVAELSRPDQHPLALGRFDLILALSLLQSPGVRRDVLLKALCRHHLTEIGGLVLGFPNARYCDGLLSYGARMRNFARPDLSLLCADVTDTRRDLQKRGFQVFVTGKYEVLLTALPVARRVGRELIL